MPAGLVHRGLLVAMLAWGALAPAQAQLAPDARATVTPNLPSLRVVTREVPAVAGMKLKDAESMLGKLGFRTEPIAVDAASANARDLPNATVVRSVPAAGTVVRMPPDPGLVKLYVKVDVPPPPPPASQPPSTPTPQPVERVPDVVKLTCAQAQAVVNAASKRLTLRCTTAGGRKAPPDARIVSQQPAPRSPIAQPTLLFAAVADAPTSPVDPPSRPAPGRERVEVPMLEGRSEADASSLLQGRGLRGDAVGAPATVGRIVVAQKPAAGTRVEPGSVVSMQLALTVPSLAGLTCDAALERAATHGLRELACTPQRTDPGRPLRRVFEQSPAPDTRLRQPAPLRALVAEPVTVPEVTGRTLAVAQARLRAAGLEGRADSGEGDRTVRAQRPRAGTEVAPGSTVQLDTVHVGTVPDLVGLTLRNARARLAQARLEARPDAVDAEDERVVDRQAPAAGARLVDGGAVALVTSLRVAVPRVVGERLDAAAGRLKQAGLEAAPDRGDRPAEREVRGQAPAAGERVRRGTRVALETVRRVEVPDLQGRTCDEARALARAAGLVAQRCTVDGDWRLPIGEPTVARQSVAARSVVDEASVVALEASRPWWPTVTAGGTSLLAALLFFFRPKPDPDLSPDATAARLLGMLSWRVAPDPRPRLELRFAAADDDTADPGEGLRWRVSPGAPQLGLRGLPPKDLVDEERAP